MGIPQRDMSIEVSREPASVAQKERITQMSKGKIKVDRLSKSDAGAIIGQMLADMGAGLSTVPQRDVLTKRLAANNLTPEAARAMTKEQASAYISQHKTWG